MTVPTIQKINQKIAEHGVEIVKGNGYFYFAAISDDAPEIPSVYTMRLRDLSLEEWVEHVSGVFA
jgi:hypothetical protein